MEVYITHNVCVEDKNKIFLGSIKYLSDLAEDLIALHFQKCTALNLIFYIPTFIYNILYQ